MYIILFPASYERREVDVSRLVVLRFEWNVAHSKRIRSAFEAHSKRINELFASDTLIGSEKDVSLIVSYKNDVFLRGRGRHWAEFWPQVKRPKQKEKAME
jgi:hypothetical protein